MAGRQQHDPTVWEAVLYGAGILAGIDWLSNDGRNIKAAIDFYHGLNSAMTPAAGQGPQAAHSIAGAVGGGLYWGHLAGLLMVVAIGLLIVGSVAAARGRLFQSATPTPADGATTTALQVKGKGGRLITLRRHRSVIGYKQGRRVGL